MKTPQDNARRSIQNGLIVLKLYEPQLPAIHFLRAELQKADKEIDALAFAQFSENTNVGYDGATLKRLKDALREKHLLKLKSTAEVLLEGMPGIKEDFAVPHKKCSVTDLLEAAERIARNAERHKAVFLRAKLKKGFIKELRAAAKALEAKSKNPDTIINRRARATASLPEPIRRGRRIMKSIGRILAAELPPSSVALSQWKEAERLPKKMGRPKKRRSKDNPPTS